MVTKALIIRPGALGDTLMLLPALKSMQREVDITVAGRQPGLFFLGKAGFRCSDMEGAGWHSIFREDIGRPTKVSVPWHDRVVAFMADKDGKIRENLRVCFPESRVRVIPAYPPEHEKVHVALHVCRMLAGAGLPVDPKAAMKKACNHALIPRMAVAEGRRQIVLHPGSGSPRKNLHPDVWLAFFRQIRKRLSIAGCSFTFLLGPAEKHLRDFYENHASGTAEIMFCPEKKVLGALLGRAVLYAGHDSGITHLAAMLGTPTIAVFKNSDVSQWHPLGPTTKVIRYQAGDREFFERAIDTGIQLLLHEIYDQQFSAGRERRETCPVEPYQRTPAERDTSQCNHSGGRDR